MLEAIKVFILAIVQGIGEFLPISSSGHLLVLGELLFKGELEEGAALGILLHAGTLLSILTVFRREICAILFNRKNWRVLLLLIVGSIPTAIIGFTIEAKADFLIDHVTPVVGIGFLLTAWLLLGEFRNKNKQTLSDQNKKDSNEGTTPFHSLQNEEKTLSSVSYWDAIIIGIFQGIAVLPGFSRSGFTISAALMRKVRREDAALFSFLLAIPAIGGATLLEAIKFLKSDSAFANTSWGLWLSATLVSFIVGIISLVWLLKWLRGGSLYRFAWWLIPLGFAVLWWCFF